MTQSSQTHYHFIGIKGVGLTSLALCAQDRGYHVTGWDVDEYFVTEEILKKRKIAITTDPGIPGRPDLVIATAAHGGLKNPQVVVAQSLGLPVVSYAEALGMMMHGKIGISVCGVGGKTTTDAMIATIFDRANLHPSFVNGVGDIPSLGAPGRYDPNGKYFIAEADEYAVSPYSDNRPKFVFQKPKAIVVTNIEHDHPDIYPSLKETMQVFAEFFAKLPPDGVIVAQIDNQNTSQVIEKLASHLPTISVGFSPRSDWQITKLYQTEHNQIVHISKNGIEEKFTLQVPGEYNVVNALAAAAVSNHFSVPWDKIQKGLYEFTGTKRRFELVGKSAGIRIYDDYAHHPSEIKAVIKAARQWCPGGRIIVAFQPHTYSRTKVLFTDFVRALSGADYILLTDIYASKREIPDEETTSQLLADAVGKINKHVKYVGPKESLINNLASLVRTGDVILTLGAGDIFHIHPRLLDALGI